MRAISTDCSKPFKLGAGDKLGVRSEEWHSQTEQIALTKQRKHRAKRAIKRGVKPDARGLVGSRGKAPAEYEAEPHSA